MIYLLDTSIIVNYLRGSMETRDQIVELAHAGLSTMSVITFGELLYGAHKSGAYKKENERIKNLIDDFHMTVLPMTQEIIGLFAAAKYALERKGNKLDDFDLLIGATAVANRLTLVTDNLRHFQIFPGITLWDRN